MAIMKTKNSYTAESIEVLKGLEPVKRRPGMYTDTLRPNHLGQEAIDNSVDEAIAGFADRIDVILHKDHSLEVRDNGRGMPVDIHPQEKISGVELILTRLHAGAKFSNKDYQFSGGLHGVGVSVVNALSARLDVRIKRGGSQYHISFADGRKTQDLAIIGSVGQKNTGTTVHFWPDGQYFEFPKFSVKRLKHVLRAKAVLCPGLTVNFTDGLSGEKHQWHYADGLQDYLAGSLENSERIPEIPFVGRFKEDAGTLDWAVLWLSQDSETVA